MNNLENVTKAQRIIKKMEALKASYNALQVNGAHVSICNHLIQKEPVVPITDELMPAIKELILGKIDDAWLELKEICKDDDQVDDEDSGEDGGDEKDPDEPSAETPEEPDEEDGDGDDEQDGSDV